MSPDDWLMYLKTSTLTTISYFMFIISVYVFNYFLTNSNKRQMHILFFRSLSLEFKVYFYFIILNIKTNL